MKSKIELLALILFSIFALGLGSCTDDSVPDIVHDKTQIYEQLAIKIGKQHNESLEFVFDDLERNGDISSVNEMQLVLKSGLKRYSRTI